MPRPERRRRPGLLGTAERRRRGVQPRKRVGSEASGARYINVTPWFCAATCTAIIGKYDVYLDDNHITATYSLYLAGVLSKALNLMSSS